MKFEKSKADPCIFIQRDKNNEPTTIIGVYVDDCLVAGEDEKINKVKKLLMNLFKMHDLGPLTFALGIKFDQQEDYSIQMSQELYVKKLLHKFSMQDCSVMDTPLPIKSNSEDNKKLFPGVNKYQ